MSSASGAWSGRSTPPPGGQRPTGAYNTGSAPYGTPGSGPRTYSSPPPSWGSAPRSQAQTATAPRPNPLATLLFGSLLQPFMRSSVTQQRSFIRRWVGAALAAVSAFLWDWAVDRAPLPDRMRDMGHRYRRQSFATVMAVTMVITMWISLGGPGALWGWTWQKAGDATPGVIAYAQSVPGRVHDIAIEAKSLLDQHNTVLVSARQDWQATNILVEKGNRVSIKADDGAATLLAGIGGETYTVQPNSDFTADTSGILYLRINDATPTAPSHPVSVTVAVSR